MTDTLTHALPLPGRHPWRRARCRDCAVRVVTRSNAATRCAPCVAAYQQRLYHAKRIGPRRGTT